MPKPTREKMDQISVERALEISRWVGDLRRRTEVAFRAGDYDTIVALHRALAGVMRRMQQREIDSHPDT